MKRPALIGIVNVTPDSFSDGGLMGAAAVKHAEALAHAGADILDIGAESTRPGAVLIDADEEWARLEPVLTSIHAAYWRAKIRLSLDTRHLQTATRALELGLDIINDVSDNGRMAMLMQEHVCDLVVMHHLGIPADPKQTLPEECDPVQAILRWKEETTKRMAAQGIGAERLIFDPGIAFGKTAKQSLELVLRAPELVATHGRWLFGHSRKSFVALIAPIEASERDPLTRAFSPMLAQAGVDYLRVHDVAGHCTMLDAVCT